MVTVHLKVDTPAFGYSFVVADEYGQARRSIARARSRNYQTVEFTLPSGNRVTVPEDTIFGVEGPPVPVEDAEDAGVPGVDSERVVHVDMFDSQGVAFPTLD